MCAKYRFACVDIHAVNGVERAVDTVCDSSDIVKRAMGMRDQPQRDALFAFKLLAHLFDFAQRQGTPTNIKWTNPALTVWAIGAVDKSSRAMIGGLPQEECGDIVGYHVLNIIHAFRQWDFSKWMVGIQSDGITYIRGRASGAMMLW